MLTDKEGIVLKLGEMRVEELYHCIFEGTVFLFYKDSQEFLHCYEIADTEVVKEINEHPRNFKNIIKKYGTKEKVQ